MVTYLAGISLVLAAVAWRRPPSHPASLIGISISWVWPPLTPFVLLASYQIGPAIQRLTRRRELQARAAWIPDLLLLLRISAEDGLSVVATMLHLPIEVMGPLSLPLRSFREELLASSDLSSALARLSRDLAFPAGRNLISAIRAGETLGVPLRQTMAAQESIARQSRTALIRRQAAFVPYLLTLLAGLFMINAAILFGYPHLVTLVQQFGFLPGKGLI
ncbi:MAG: hypothetical protein ACYCO4_02600 [Sulfobacillus sp.]